MSWIDIVLIAAIVIFMIIGCIKGFWKTLGSLFGTLICLVAAYLVTSLLLDKLLAIPALNKLFYGESGSLAVALKGIVPNFGALTVAEAVADPTLVTNQLGGGIWALFQGMISSFIAGLNKSGAYSDTPLSDCVAVVAARAVGWIVMFLIVFILLKLISKLFKKLGNAVKKHKFTRSMDRLLGFVMGGAKGLVVIIVVLFAMNCLRGVAFLKPVFHELDNNTVIASPLSKFSVRLINQTIDVEKLTGGLIKNPHLAEPEEEAAAASLDVWNTKNGAMKAYPKSCFAAEAGEGVTVASGEIKSRIDIVAAKLADAVTAINKGTGLDADGLDRLQSDAAAVEKLFSAETDGLVTLLNAYVSSSGIDQVAAHDAVVTKLDEINSALDLFEYNYLRAPEPEPEPEPMD